MSKNLKHAIFSFCLWTSISAPPVTYQQLAVVLKPEAQQFSLATGRAYLNYAKNLYKFGPEGSAVTQLARNPKVGLFNLNDVTFRTTANKSNPSMILHGQLAGRVLGGIGTQKIFEKAFETELLDFWRDYYKKQFPQDTLISKKRVETIIDLIKKSIEETQSEKSIFLPSTPTSLIMTSQVLQEQPWEKIIEMYKELSSFGLVDFSSINPGRLFSDIELEKFKDEIKTSRNTASQAKLIIQNPELAIASQERMAAQLASLPPAPKQAEYCYKESNVKVPNCVETGLHDLVNLIVYDPETKTFNPAKMLPPTVSPNPTLKGFYHTAPQADESAINNSRQNWFNLVSEIPHIHYWRKNHELVSNFENQLGVLNNLFGTHATTFEELGKQLSTPQRQIIFTYTQKIVHNDKTSGTLEMYISNLNQTFTLQSQLGQAGDHGFLERRKEETSSLFSDDMQKELAQHPEQLATFLPYILNMNPEYAHLTIFNYDLSDPNKVKNIIQTITKNLEIFPLPKKLEIMDKIVMPLMEKQPLNDFNFLTFYLDILNKYIALIPPENEVLKEKIYDIAEKCLPNKLPSFREDLNDSHIIHRITLILPLLSASKKEEIIEGILPIIEKRPRDNVCDLSNSIEKLIRCKRAINSINSKLKDKINNLIVELFSDVFENTKYHRYDYQQSFEVILDLKEEFHFDSVLSEKINNLYDRLSIQHPTWAIQALLSDQNSDRLISFLNTYLSSENFNLFRKSIDDPTWRRYYFKERIKNKSIQEIVDLLHAWPKKIALLYFATEGFGDLPEKFSEDIKNETEKAAWVQLYKKYKNLTQELPQFKFPLRVKLFYKVLAYEIKA
jgi:hypothetical protein